MEMKGRNNMVDAVHKLSTLACEATIKMDSAEISSKSYEHEEPFDCIAVMARDLHL